MSCWWRRTTPSIERGTLSVSLVSIAVKAARMPLEIRRSVVASDGSESLQRGLFPVRPTGEVAPRRLDSKAGSTKREHRLEHVLELVIDMSVCRVRTHPPLKRGVEGQR